MVKYAKSLYWASLIVYGSGAVIFPMLYLKSGKLIYIGMELIFIVMLLKELRDYRKHHSNSKDHPNETKRNSLVNKVFDWNWCRACDWTWTEYACYWRHHCNLRWHRPYARDLESVTPKPCSPTLFNLLFGKLVERARSFVPGP